MAGTIQDIAEIAGVSRGTVDRALNKRGRINKDVEERILQIAVEIGYEPRRKRKDKVENVKIGVVTQLSGAPFMKAIRRGIRDALKDILAQRAELLMEECDNVNEESQLEALDNLEKAGVLGIAIMPVDGPMIRSKMLDLVDKGIKVITFNTDIIGAGRSCFVGMDNIRSGRTAAGLIGTMLKKQGQVLAITGHFGNSVNNMRVEGFTDELKKSYKKIDLIGVQSSFDESKEVERIVKNSMETFPELKGIVVFSAGQSGVINAFKQIKMEDRPFVIVYDLTPDNIMGIIEEEFDFIIDQNGYMQGYKSLCILVDLVRGDSEPAKEYYYTDIVIKNKFNI